MEMKTIGWPSAWANHPGMNACSCWMFTKHAEACRSSLASFAPKALINCSLCFAMSPCIVMHIAQFSKEEAHHNSENSPPTTRAKHNMTQHHTRAHTQWSIVALVASHKPSPINHDISNNPDIVSIVFWERSFSWKIWCKLWDFRPVIYDFPILIFSLLMKS